MFPKGVPKQEEEEGEEKEEEIRGEGGVSK